MTDLCDAQLYAKRDRQVITDVCPANKSALLPFRVTRKDPQNVCTFAETGMDLPKASAGMCGRKNRNHGVDGERHINVVRHNAKKIVLAGAQKWRVISHKWSALVGDGDLN